MSIHIQDSVGNTPLHRAVWDSNIGSVRYVIENTNCDINIQNSRGYTPLHIAVEKGNKTIVRCLIEHIDCNVNIQNDRRNTPLHIAVGDENIEIIRCLIENTRCNVDIQNSDGKTPLHIGVQKGNIDIVRCLIENTYVNIQDRGGNTPLHIAVGKGNVTIVRCLVLHVIENADCDVNIQNRAGYTPLHTAVLKGNIDIVRYLIDHTTCDVNILDSVHYTPLHTAVQRGDIDIVRCLIENTNCNVNIQESDSKTPLHIAVQEGNTEIVRCLLENTNCNVNIQNKGGFTPLHRAVLGGNKEIVRCLIADTTCDVNIQDNEEFYTPLHRAAWSGNIEILKCLIDHATCDVNIQGRHGWTPFLIALQFSNIEVVRCLITNIACDVNIQDTVGNAPLYIAIQNYNMQNNNTNIEMVRCLIVECNCDVNIKMYCLGQTPFSSMHGLQFLHEIAKHQRVELFYVLIHHNVNVLTNHVDNQLRLVKFILRKHDFQSLWFFIQNGLYINCLTSSGENIVHLLAKFYMDYVYIDFSFLLYYGLDFNRINNDGNSPLMVASLLNNLPFIKFLAALPCNPNRKNHQGHTALHLCVIGFTLIKEKLNIIEVNSVVQNECAYEYYPRYLACIGTLLKLGVDVNMQNIGGKTVLMLACIRNDRKLLETLLIYGADVNIVDNHGRSALQYIDLTNNVYDLTCFNLLLSHGCRQSFNQPCLNGNTIIQNVLQFTPLWQIDDIANFIKFLVFKNVNLQLLTSGDGEIFYGQLSLDEFSSESRHELRQILYLSGGSFVQITQILHFEVEEEYEASLPESLREKPREKFHLFANNLSLKEICRRVIRQNTGLSIHDQITELLNFPILTDFLMFKDIDSRRFSLPVSLESCIDDDYDDDYNSYDLNTENDEYNNDYLYMYIDCKYLNEEHSGLKRPQPDPDYSDLYSDFELDLDLDSDLNLDSHQNM